MGIEPGATNARLFDQVLQQAVVRLDLGLNCLLSPVRLASTTHLLCTASQSLVSGQLTNLALRLCCRSVGAHFILPRYFWLHVCASCGAHLRIAKFVCLLTILGSVFG